MTGILLLKQLSESNLMQNTPLVSVFVCTYNQENYIEQTLDSFLMQECNFDFEIVIGEDCSKDNTLKICIDYQNRFPDKIKLLNREKNLGLIENFFEGLGHCTGKYIATCGGDDYWTDSTKLQKQVEFLEKNPDYVIAYHDSIMVDEHNVLIKNSEVGIENQRDFSSDELQKGAFISARTICFRNIVNFTKINYKKVLNEDYFLFAILGEFGKGKYLDNIKPSVYRILQQGVWSSRTEIQRQIAKMSTLKSLENYYNSKLKKDISNYFKKKYHEYNNSVFYLTANSNQNKLLWNSYLIALFYRKHTYNKISFINLNKTLLKALIISPKS